MIAEVTTRCTFVLEAPDLDAAEELIGDLICGLGEHPSLLADPDPSVRAHSVDDEIWTG